MASWWHSGSFQEPLISFLCRDRNFLKKCGSYLKAKDFKPSRDETSERYIVATLALEFWNKYKAPIEGLLRPNVEDYIRRYNVDSNVKKSLYKLVDKINSGERLPAVEAMEDRVIDYLREKAYKDSIEELISKAEANELDNESFVKICRKVLDVSGKKKYVIESYLDEKELDRRIARRAINIKNKRPLLFLPEFDSKPGNFAIGRGDLGLWLAPYKKGKSLALAHIAKAYAMQNLKVLYITLEDPKEEVEDRMDAAAVGIPIHKLNELPNRLKKRFRRLSKRINGQIRIVDATEESLTVQGIEEIWENLRDSGWTADAIIIDYDDEIKPANKHKERRFEFAEIYRDLRKLAARRSLFVWTAAQTRKVKDNTKIISGDTVSEDVSKIRKATLVLGMGQGESHKDAKYVFIAAAKRAPSLWGFEVVANPACGLFYDEDLTFEFVTKKKKAKVLEMVSKKKRTIAA